MSGHNLEMLVRRLCSRKNTDDKIDIGTPRRSCEIVITDGKFFNISSGDVQIIEEENALVMPDILPLSPALKSCLTSSSVLAKELSIGLAFLSVEKMHEVC